MIIEVKDLRGKNKVTNVIQCIGCTFEIDVSHCQKFEDKPGDIVTGEKKCPYRVGKDKFVSSGDEITIIKGGE